MMMARLILAAFLFFSFTKAVTKSETIQWSANRKLSWSDFKAMPPENVANAALTSSGILMSFSTNGEAFRYELSCKFDQNASWGRVKNEYILAHEQGHFDIAELYTRKLNKALRAYRYRPGSISNDVNTIYKNTMQELQETQDRYDQQTDHSRDIIQQKEWLIRIKNSLDDLQAYAGYNNQN